jgi:phosphoglycerol transferase MdoB-like AlkP superfamily enzyme
MSILVLFNVLIFTALRFIFLYQFHNPADPLSAGLLIKSMYIGFKFDLRLVLLINLPVFLLARVKYVRIFDKPSVHTFWSVYIALINSLILLLYMIDFGFYAYLTERLNASAIRFTYNPLISLQMMWETYPLLWGIAGLIIFIFLFTKFVKFIFKTVNSADCTSLQGWKNIMLYVLMVVLWIAGIYGKFSYYPLRWSDAFFSPHNFASSLALNPVLHVFDTVKNREVRYDMDETKKYYDLLASYLGVEHPDRESLNFTRHIRHQSSVSEKPNIIFVITESLAFYKTGISGNPLNPTPHIDAIAKESLLFNRFYVPHGGTARSVFTFITGLPDVEVNKTSSRNPLIVKQHTILNAFDGYKKLYFLGGSASWANIRGLLSHNIPDIDIYEEGSYDSPRVDVWGIPDLHLFQEANTVLNRIQDRPFIAIIQTSGSHRPYTIPEDNRGFEYRNENEEEVKKYGFDSNEEFNAFRFIDHGIGLFMETARQEKYFDNTIFVFFGDHGLPGHPEHRPVAEEHLMLTRFHVPFFIYAPAIIPEGRVYDMIASEVDVLPTVASLASTSYLNTTLGRNLLDSKYEANRYAFIVEWHGPVSRIGLLDNRFYFIMNSDGSNKRLHLLDNDEPREDMLREYPDKAESMEQLCLGLYETSRYISYHNAPE